MEAFHSKSEALQYIGLGIERGQYRDCGQLSIIETLNVLHGRRHHPYCKAHSLRKNETYGGVASTCCPNPCHFFITKDEFQAEQKKLAREKSVRRAGNAVVKTAGTVALAPFLYFQKLPTIVQSLLIILLVIWLFPQFKATIIDILKALRS